MWFDSSAICRILYIVEDRYSVKWAVELPFHKMDVTSWWWRNSNTRNPGGKKTLTKLCMKPDSYTLS